MDLSGYFQSDLKNERKQVLSLQTGCISCIVEHLDEYPTEHLSLLPSTLRRQLLTCLPPLDILKLEGTSVVSGLDMNEVWHVIAQHYAEADDTSVLPETFKSLRYYFRSLRLYHRDQLDYDLANANFYKTIEDDWRSIFLTRTLYIMLHTFNPSSVSTNVSHTIYCGYEGDTFSCCCESEESSSDTSESGNPAECSCWGLGMDPLHYDIFWRLIALPLRSELALHYNSFKDDNQTSTFVAVKYYDYNSGFLVPNRHAGYLTGTSILELITTLLNESHFRPKVMIFNCGFLHYSEFYQHLLSDTESNKSQSLSFFADMLSEVECLEFYWLHMPQKTNEQRQSKFDLNASLHTLSTVLGAIFKNPSPKLTSFCVRTSPFPTLHDCLPSITPFFSAHHYTEASKNAVLPISMAYAGLKNVHIFAEENLEKDLLQDISSIVLHQSCFKGLEMDIKHSVCFHPNFDLLRGLIQDVVSQPQLQFFVFKGYLNFGRFFEKPFRQFLNNNRDFEIFASVHDHDVIIPVRSSSETLSEKKKFIICHPGLMESGSIFSWLRNAQITKPLKFVKSNEGIDNSYRDALKHWLPDCEALVWDHSFFFIPSTLPAFFRETKCPNLQTVSLPRMPTPILLNLLPALFASSPLLKELALGEQWDERPGQNALEEVFECLVCCPYPEQLTVDLRGDKSLTQEDVEKLLQVWRKMGQGRKLKAVLLEHGLQPMIAEMTF